jgi:CHAT domain-containing protein
MGEIYQVHGFSSKAVPPLQEALAIAQKLGLKSEEGRILENLGVAEQALGSYEEAEAHLATALERSREVSGHSFERLRLEVRLGTLRALLGRYELAEENLNAALNQLDRSRSQISQKQWTNLRAVWVAQGQRALQGMGPMAAALAQSLNPESMNPEGDDDPELSKAVSQVLEEEQGGTFRQDMVPFTLNLMRGAASYTLKAGEEHVKAVLEIVTPEQADTLLPSPSCEMEILTSLSTIYRQIGRPKEAAARNERAWTLMAQEVEQHEHLLSIFPGATSNTGVAQERQTAHNLKLPIPPTFTSACARNDPAHSGERLWQGDLAAAQGRIDDAIQEYQELVQSNPTMRPMGLTRLASLYERTGDQSRALATYRQAIDAAEAVQGNLRLDELVAAWASQQASVYAQTIRMLHELGQPEVAFGYAERSRGRAFLNAIGNRRLPAAAVPPELASELHQIRQKLIELESFRKRPQAPLAAMSAMGGGDIDRRREEETARRRHQELLARLAQSNPEYLSLVQVDPVGLAPLQQEVLPADATLLEYYVLEDKTLVWVIDRESVRCLEVPITAQAIRDKVGYLRSLIEAREPSAKAEAGQLYQTLFAPLEPFIRHSNLIVVPHRELHVLPFAALWDGSRQKYLIESYTLTFAPSASALRFMKRQKPAGGRFLALGNPDGSLPHAEQEVKAIAGLHGSPPWLGKEARESRLRQEAPGVGTLHLAVHAYFDPLDPALSRIELAPDLGTSSGTESSDGHLHVYEVYDLDLRACRLAVLSACETAYRPPQEDRGDDLVGLARAFLYAGASAVVTTLWPVNDESTAALMESFYQLRRQGAPTAKALQQAQIQALHRDSLAAPYYWAAFTLNGG